MLPDDVQDDVSVFLEFRSAYAVNPGETLPGLRQMRCHFLQGPVMEYRIGRDIQPVGDLFAFFPQKLKKAGVVLTWGFRPGSEVCNLLLQKPLDGFLPSQNLPCLVGQLQGSVLQILNQ